MRLLLLSTLFTLFSIQAFSQEKFSLYKPEADANKEINAAIASAKANNKHVFIQVGGNWCSWCKLFNDLVTKDESLHKLMDENFVTVHLNYSKENFNEPLLAQLDYPQRFGFPVFVVLDGNGKRIHTQNSSYLEEGKSHSPKKVSEFLNQWSPKAVNPESYKGK